MTRHPYPLLYIKKYGKLPQGFDINQYPYLHFIIKALKKSRKKN